MYPFVRLAVPSDYEAIWKIWMQDHIVQWMSFPKVSMEDFKTHYDRMKNSSDIYVLVDKIEGQEKVVAVRRIEFGKNQYKYNAEYCSMGVDAQHQGKGYAKFLYDAFEKIAREKGIKRVALTQDGGNLAAFHIADKNFSEEAVFPDWLYRTQNKGDFYLISRFMYRFLDPELAKTAAKLPSLKDKYKECVPALQIVNNEAVTVVRIQDQFKAYLNKTLLLTLDFEPGTSVLQHIGFLSINLDSNDHPQETLLALKQILLSLLQQGRVKKLELFTTDPTVAKFCQATGFFCRGEKVASFYDEKEGYKNEIGLEYSFFTILDAQNLTKAKVSASAAKEVDDALSNCSNTIKKLVAAKVCDALGACYLENLIYQIVRDDIGQNKVLSLADKRWETLIKEVPSELQNDIHRLRNRLQNTMTPFVRRALPNDYEAIWKIWMQDHIIQWMSFSKQEKEEFKAHYARMDNSSDIYVLVDKIEGQEKVVAVRRIKLGKNQYKHNAEYCSMGVDAQHQGKGYAKFLYDAFEKIAREAGIKRIQLTQSGGNLAAFHIADKNFSEEAVFPDWLQRAENKNDFYLIERYIYRFLDPELAKTATKLPSLKYQELVPTLQIVNNEAITIERTQNQFKAYFKQVPLLTLDFEPDNSVIQHIGFLSIKLDSKDHPQETALALKQVLLNLLQEGRVKKLELFTEDHAVAKFCQATGFFCRGEKVASFYDEKEGYKNEVGLEYSFFNILDAQNLTKAKVSGSAAKGVDDALSSCSNTIKKLVAAKICDALGACYLENLIYQIVRDDIGQNKVLSLVDKRWETLIKEIPSDLQIDIHRLRNRLQNTSTLFFKEGKLENNVQQDNSQLVFSQKLP